MTRNAPEMRTWNDAARANGWTKDSGRWTHPDRADTFETAHRLCEVLGYEVALVMVCNICGSDNVTCDASATWDVDAQEWMMGEPMNSADCFDCGGECRILEEDAARYRGDLNVTAPSAPADFTGAVSGDWLVRYPNGRTIETSEGDARSRLADWRVRHNLDEETGQPL